MRILLPALVAGLAVFIALFLAWRRWGFGRRRALRWPDPDDIILPPLPPPEPVVLTLPAPEPPPPPPPIPPPQGTIFLADLDVGETVHCMTLNSHYRFRLIDKALGWFEVSGGRVPRTKGRITAHFVSSHRTGRCHHDAFAPGMSLQFFIQAPNEDGSKRMTTSLIVRVFAARTTAGS